MASRGFDPDVTAKRFRLGVVDRPAEAHKHYTGWLSVPNLLCDRWGNERVVGMKFRNPDHEASAKYMYPKGQAVRLYNARALREASDTIALAEGECFPGDAQVLTEGGWVRLDEWDGQHVAQWSEGGALEMVKPVASVRKQFSGELVDRSFRGYTSITTPGHRLPAIGRRGNLRWVTAEVGSSAADYIPRAGFLDGPGIDLTDDEIRMVIAISADAGLYQNQNGRPYVRFNLLKTRKIERLRKLAANCGILLTEWTDKDPRKVGAMYMAFSMPERLNYGRLLPWSWITEATSEQRELLLAELVHWDGNHVPNRNQTEYVSKWMHNAEWAQALAHTTGRVSSIIRKSNQWGSVFKVSLLHGKSTSSWQAARIVNRRIPFHGEVFCLTVPSGALLVRQDEHVTVSGNCDTWSADACGLPVIGIPGAKTFGGENSYRLRLLEGFSRVILLQDNDDAGAGLASELESVDGLEVKTMPNGLKDVNQALVELGPDALREYILHVDHGGFDDEED